MNEPLAHGLVEKVAELNLNLFIKGTSWQILMFHVRLT